MHPNRVKPKPPVHGFIIRMFFENRRWSRRSSSYTKLRKGIANPTPPGCGNTPLELLKQGQSNSQLGITIAFVDFFSSNKRLIITATD